MDPTVERLLSQLEAAGFPTRPQRLQGLPAPIRELHRRILAHFAATSQAPPPATLTAWAAEHLPGAISLPSSNSTPPSPPGSTATGQWSCTAWTRCET